MRWPGAIDSAIAPSELAGFRTSYRPCLSYLLTRNAYRVKLRSARARIGPASVQAATKPEVFPDGPGLKP